jgi:hypothetical protein
MLAAMRGPAIADKRRTINGILWVLRTGAQLQSSDSKLTQGLLQGILTLNSFGPTCRIGWRWPEVPQPVERIFDTPMQLIEGAC